MQTFFSTRSIVLTIALCALSGQPVFAKMYRWVDESGNVHYSDQVPPDQVKHRREALNDKARVVDVVEREKTKAERELDKRLEELRKQQEKIIAKQKANDKVLLSTFRNVDDMKLAMKGKLLALDGQRNVIQNNLARLEQQLQQQQMQAAQYERDGKKVPAKLVKKIENTKEQIELAFVEVARQFEKKKRISAKFESDIARFMLLTESREVSDDIILETAETRAANELGLYICENRQQCDIAWEAAKQFVQKHSSTDLDIETDKLIMSRDPLKDNEISLSVSKMEKDKKRLQLFLDVRCRKSSVGDELCRSAKILSIRQTFHYFVKNTVDERLKLLGF